MLMRARACTGAAGAGPSLPGPSLPGPSLPDPSLPGPEPPCAAPVNPGLLCGRLLDLDKPLDPAASLLWCLEASPLWCLEAPPLWCLEGSPLWCLEASPLWCRFPRCRGILPVRIMRLALMLGSCPSPPAPTLCMRLRHRCRRARRRSSAASPSSCTDGSEGPCPCHQSTRLVRRSRSPGSTACSRLAIGVWSTLMSKCGARFFTLTASPPGD